jgi:hypothetical protein
MRKTGTESAASLARPTDPRKPPTRKGDALTATLPAAEVVAANPGPAVHLAALGILVLVGLAAYAVVQWRRRREAAEAERHPPDTHDASSANRPSETPGS